MWGPEHIHHGNSNKLRELGGTGVRGRPLPMVEGGMMIVLAEKWRQELGSVSNGIS